MGPVLFLAVNAMSLPIHLLLVIASALLLQQELLGQAQILGKIIGEIRLESGEFPRHQILVQLFLRGAAVDSVYSDTQGAFGFSNLNANGYRIVINEEGFYPADEAAIVNPSSSPITTVHIVLRPRESSRKDPLGERASGSNPYLVASADYKKVLPKQAQKEYKRALDAERKGSIEDSVEAYREVVRIAPDFYPAHNNLGSLYLSRSDFRSAEEQFREAIRLDENEAQAYFNLGNTMILTGRYADAESVVSAGLQRRPDSAFGDFLWGSLLSHAGKYEEAEKALREALRLDVSLWQVHLQLVNLYLQQARHREAIAQLQTFLQLFPTQSAAPKAAELLHRLQIENTTAPPAK